ncbi:MAG: class I SAM-dependent methyltransferase, partial [Gammaproteobacteria bacterium]
MSPQASSADASAVTQDELEAIFDIKYRRAAQLGPGPALRLAYRYFTPDDHYEAVVRRLVGPHTRWLDVGCGRNLFPSNQALARELSERCAELVGVDPDDTLQENPFVHRKLQGFVEEVVSTDERFDLVTFRMVAEHVTEPEPLLRALRAIVVPGGHVVVYTVNRWSPVPLLTAVTPFALHNPIKYVLWRTEAKDTFPTAFRMNTRTRLRQLFEAHDFREAGFSYLDDCRTFQGFRLLNT